MAAGGKREGSGRKKGVPNKATAEIKELARSYGPDALKKLAEMAGLVKNKKPAESEQARVAAINQILDRGFGKPSQTVSGDEDAPIKQIVEIQWLPVKASDS